ncbi:hypothetical protein L204_104017 [Cryptococcus depauperatus]
MSIRVSLGANPSQRKSSTVSSVSNNLPNLLSLPNEILEHIFRGLTLNDRLKLMRTCKALSEIYINSAPLQYLATLQTSAYVDCPWSEKATSIDCPLPATPESVSPSSLKSEPERPIAFRSPHTGRYRSTIGSVTLAPWPKEPPEKFPFEHATSAAEKCDRLRDRERRWETMDAKEKRVFKVQGREGVYELQEGIFLLCDDSGDEEDQRPQAIRLIPLPSSDDPDLESPSIPTKGHRLSFPIADLTMDPTQDLIVISEYIPPLIDRFRVRSTTQHHLLTMSTFVPHPLASLPILEFPPPVTPMLPRSRQLLQIMGDTLAILVAKYNPVWGLLDAFNIDPLALEHRTQEEEIVVWNWKLGRVLSRLPFTFKSWFSSFALLSPTTFIVTSTSLTCPSASPQPSDKRPTIQIYSILTNPSHTIIPVQPLENEVMDDTTPRPVLLAVLEMPELREQMEVIEFEIRPDPPFPPKTPSGSHELTLVKNKPFTQDPNKGIVIFNLGLQETFTTGPHVMNTVRHYPFELFVLRETLVQLGQDGENRLRSTWQGDTSGLGVRGVQRNYKWTEWGEKGARMIDKVMSKRSWVCSCSGYRYISVMPHQKSPFCEYPDHEELNLNRTTIDTYPYSPEKSHIMLMDFSPFAIEKELSKGDPYPESDNIDVLGRQTSLTGTFVPPFTEGKGWKSRVVTEPTCISPGIWTEDVKSSLPYREVWREYGGLSNGVMIDDQRVIVVNTNTRRNGDWSTIMQEMTVFCM